MESYCFFLVIEVSIDYCNMLFYSVSLGEGDALYGWLSLATEIKVFPGSSLNK